MHNIYTLSHPLWAWLVATTHHLTKVWEQKVSQPVFETRKRFTATQNLLYTSMMQTRQKPKWTRCIIVPAYTNMWTCTCYHVNKLDVTISNLPLEYSTIAQRKSPKLLNYAFPPTFPKYDSTSCTTKYAHKTVTWCRLNNIMLMLSLC